MTTDRNRAVILMADDDEDDQMLVRDALEELGLDILISFVNDGEELLAHLRRQARGSQEDGEPLPGLILLDLNMPRKDGREALHDIKTDPCFRKIPVVVLTTSKSDEDVDATYGLGVNSFVTKPDTFDELVAILREMTSYWFETVRLPH